MTLLIDRLEYRVGVVEALSETLGRRERKKQRTRRALIEAAYRLFDQQGYEQTTVAEIAEMADVSNATFFNHFAAKEDLLFANGQPLLDEAVRVIAERPPDATPVDVLADAMRHMMTAARGGVCDPSSPLERIRVRLLLSVPALQAATLRRLFDAQQQLARALYRAYSHELDELTAATMVGAVTGAMLAAVDVSLRQANPTEFSMDTAFQHAIDTAILILQSAPSAGRQQT